MRQEKLLSGRRREEGGGGGGGEAGRRREKEEERILIKDLKRHGRLAVAWDRHGSPVPRWT